MFGWFKKKTPERVGAERRIAKRHPCDLKVNDRLVVSVGLSSWPAIVADISTTGIGLVLGVRHDPGAALQIELFCASNGYARSIRAQIVRTKRMPDGYWFCGCAFDEQLDHGELNALL